MIHFLVFLGVTLYIGLCVLLDYLRVPWKDRVQKFPKGHIHEYDPDGLYTYKHLNPRFRSVV